MANGAFLNISDRAIGALMITFGTILLLHTFHIIEHGLNTVIVGISILMIVLGFFKTGLNKKIAQLIRRGR